MALNWPWFEPGMAYLGGNGVDFPLRQAYCFLCGFHLHDIEQMLHPDREDEWNPSVVGGRDPWPLQWLKDLAYVTIHPDRTCNYNIYKSGELTDEDIYVGDDPDIVARTRRLVVVEEKPWHRNEASFGPVRQYAAHDACMQILLKTFKYRSNRFVNSVSDLYRALEKQCWSETAHVGPRPFLSSETYRITTMSWDHEYFGALEKRRLVSWTAEHCSSYLTCEIDPLAPIPGLTDYVLSHLEPLRIAPGTTYLADRIEALPQELQDSISQYDTLPMADNCTLEPTRYKDPESWMLGLASGKALPWLEHLDQGKCAAKHREKPDGGREWDWELLVRRLAQTNIFERGQPMHSAPQGLRNLRRVWRCCVEMEPAKVDHEKILIEEYREQFSKPRKTAQDTLPSRSTVAQQAQQPAAHVHAPAASSSKSQK